MLDYWRGGYDGRLWDECCVVLGLFIALASLVFFPGWYVELDALEVGSEEVDAGIWKLGIVWDG